MRAINKDGKRETNQQKFAITHPLRHNDEIQVNTVELSLNLKMLKKLKQIF